MSDESPIEWTTKLERVVWDETRHTLEVAVVSRVCGDRRLATPADLLAAGYVPATQLATLQSELEKTRGERDSALERARNAEARADASAIYNATTQKEHPGAHVMVLDEYQRANLLWLFRQCGYPYQEGAPQLPFNTGDWLGELAIKAGMDRPPSYAPNAPEDRGATWLAAREASLRADVERLTKQTWELGTARDEAVAELARLRPIVEAAKAWRACDVAQPPPHGPDVKCAALDALADAVDALAPVPKADPLPAGVDMSNPDNRFPWEDENGDGPFEPADLCRACGGILESENRRIADCCPCNSARGVNHGLVPKNTCTCAECDPAQTGSTRYPVPAVVVSVPKCPDGLTPDGPVCPRCGGVRGPSGIGGGSWVHAQPQEGSGT